MSVTTVPAAGNVAVARAVSEWTDAGGSALQLLINIMCLVVVSVCTLSVQRWYARRMARVMA